jgi:flagellar biosynthesis/type III secretory pathway protein FliH
MTVTISVEEMIAQEFDIFYREVKFKDIELSEELKSLLDILERDTITNATSDDCAEWREAWDEGHQVGWLEGCDEGYKEGKDDGHTESYDEGYEDGKYDGHTEGYDEGYERGKDDGHNEGYDEGYAEAKAEE